DDLIGKNIPAIRSTYRRTRALRRPPLPALDDRVLELPLVRRDLLLGPLAGVVLPFVAAADLHAGVALALVLLELVVGSCHAGKLGTKPPDRHRLGTARQRRDLVPSCD